MNPRSLVVSLHDVSPITFEVCASMIKTLARNGVSRCSLLVIPNHHHRAHFLKDPQFCKWLGEMSAAGHEIVHHGYFHQRPQKEAETLREKFTTRIYTAGEGEFYDISQSEATRWLEKGRTDFAQIGLIPTGFVAPAWLLSAPAEAALRALGFGYTTRLGEVLDLRLERRFLSQSLVWSVRSGWRRQVSLLWNRWLNSRLRANPLLRISLHPVDYQYRQVWQQILALLAQALVDRRSLTYEDWLQIQNTQAQSLLFSDES